MGVSRSKQPKRTASRGVIYGRQSRTKEGSESLDTQVVACAATATHHKIEVVATILEPPSTSAFKDRGRSRPRFPEVLELIRSGAIDCVVAYKTDRLSRGGGPGWAPIIEAAEAAGLDLDRFVLIAGSGFMSEFELGIRATMDREESRKTSDRLCDVRERHAVAGKPWASGRRPFGYRYDKATQTLTIDEAEAALVRDAAESLLAGAGLTAICRRWNAAGHRTATGGGTWRVSTLRNLMLRASVAGLRVHNGEVVADGQWEPILERGLWERVTALLTDPARMPTPAFRENVLSRIIKCGKCGSPLSSIPKRGRDRFCCHPGPGKPNCGGVSIVKADVEELVVAAVLAALDTPLLGRAKTDRRSVDAVDAAKRISRAEERLVELAEMWASEELTRAEYLAARRRLELQLHTARAELDDTPRPTIDVEPGLRAAWPTLPLDRRRTIVHALVERVTIGPGTPGRNAFDPERVAIEWRA